MTARRVIRSGSLAYLALILIAPVGLIFWRAFEHGLHPFWSAISNPDAAHALKLTVEVALVAVPLNTVFGVVCGLAIVRHRFPGMGLVNALVDLPMALSPVVVVLSLYLLYGRQGWFGAWLAGVHNLLADHAGGDPLGGRVRRGAHDRAGARRVRCRCDRLRRHSGADADVDAVRAGVVRELQSDRRVRRVRAARCARDRDACLDDDVQTEGGSSWQSRRVASRSGSVTSSRSTTSRSTWRAGR